MAYSDWKMIKLPILIASLVHFSENLVIYLGSEGVNRIPSFGDDRYISLSPLRIYELLICLPLQENIISAAAAVQLNLLCLFRQSISCVCIGK